MIPATSSKPIPRSTSGWSPERRANHAAAIRRWKPWEKSTGPRTAGGKARSAQNAAKPLNPIKAMDRALRMSSRQLTDINRYIKLKNIPRQNELLKHCLRRMEEKIALHHQIVTSTLVLTMTYDSLCKKLAESRNSTVKVNANDNGYT